MRAFIVESVGFSASTSISRALASNSHNVVTHGTRNFVKRLPLGNGDMDLSAFVEGMLSEVKNGRNAIALHTLYNPSKIRELAINGDFEFVSLMRRNQKAQILSFIESESRTPAVHHAAPSVLDSIDRVQRRFLKK